MSPCGPRGVAWRGCGRSVGFWGPLVGPGARWEGLGRRASPPPRPAQQRPGARRLLPGCMAASAWRSWPGSQQLARPQPSGSGGAARARETTAESVARATSSLAWPPPAAAERGVARFVCAQRGGGGPGAPGAGGGRTRAGKEVGVRVRIAPPRRGRTLPHQHPLGGGGGCAR